MKSKVNQQKNLKIPHLIFGYFSLISYISIFSFFIEMSGLRRPSESLFGDY